MSRTLLLAAALLAAAMPLPSAAYPHFQLSSETATCNACHHAPAGGGLLTDWGHDSSAEIVSGGGNGELLHGLVKMPRWLTVGGDFRLAGLANDAGPTTGTQLAAFPMQADLTARAGLDNLWGLATVGYRGSARTPPEERFSSAMALLNSFVSREHYVLWKPNGDTYVRAGRFFAPFGLRLADHTAYVRRYLGYNVLEETYGLSGGRVNDTWEVHATAFAPDPFRTPARAEAGGALLAEVRPGPAAIGLSARAGFGSAQRRLTAGLHGKLWLAKRNLLWMLEVDGTRESFTSAAGADRWQLAAYTGPVWVPLRGVYAGAAYELFDEDFAVRGTERHALGAWVSYLPWAHVEVMLSARAQLVGTSDRAWNTLLQLHYYL